MVTRKDFEDIARAFRESRPEGAGVTMSDPEVQQWGKDIASVGHALQRMNPRFDLIRFLRACQQPR